MTKKSETITVRFPADEVEQLTQWARQTRETYSEIVRGAVAAMIERTTFAFITNPEQPIVIPPGHGLNIWADMQTGDWVARVA